MQGSTSSVTESEHEASSRAARAAQRRIALFDERYGDGAHAQLITLLQRPCLSFARIAERYQVSRERVRQWHRTFLPTAPAGLERRRQCRRLRQRQQLLADPLVSTFYQLVKGQGELRVGLIRTKTGYRRRLLRVNGRLVALRRARVATVAGPGTPGVRIERYRGRGEVLYVDFGDSGFVLVPTSLVPAHGIEVDDWTRSRVTPFVNSLRALHE